MLLGSDAEEAEEKEPVELKYITVKDIAEILEKIESKQGYEAARHYAMNGLDYWKMNMLAKKFVNAPDSETEDKEADNDPNIMPTRFMLLYGADDGKLESIDDHPDCFDGGEKMKINVKMLREGLRLLGYDYVLEDGAFDDDVERAFLTYNSSFGRVDIGNTCAEEEDPKKPLDSIADKYGIATWKYLEEKHDGIINHDQITKELSPEYGDELLTKKIEEKGLQDRVTLMNFKPGVSYHYVWVPHSLNVKSADGGELKKVRIFNRTNGQLIAEHDLKNEDGKYVAEMLVPNMPMSDAIYIVDDKVMATEKFEVVNTDDIIDTYYTFDEECKQRVSETDEDDIWNSKYFHDLNLHVVVKEGNDGKLLRLTLKSNAEERICLQKIVSKSNVVFKKVFN